LWLCETGTSTGRNFATFSGHSITSSMRPSSRSGTVTPSFLAVILIDAQLDFDDLLHRQSDRLFALQDATGVDSGVPPGVNGLRLLVVPAVQVVRGELTA
jgi:hypothetical protein